MGLNDSSEGGDEMSEVGGCTTVERDGFWRDLLGGGGRFPQ